MYKYKCCLVSRTVVCVVSFISFLFFVCNLIELNVPMQLGLLISWSISVISHHIVKLINKNWPKNYYSVQCHSHFESFGKIQVCIDATSNRYTHNIHNWWRKRNENYDVKIKQTSAINMKWLFWKKTHTQ